MSVVSHTIQHDADFELIHVADDIIDCKEFMVIRNEETILFSWTTHE